MITSFWHWLTIILVGGLVGIITGFLTTRRVTGGVWLFAFVGIMGAFLVDFVCSVIFKLYIDLPVLYNLSLLFWMVVGAVVFTQILNLLGQRPD
jgi:uncharacterized membrane protein YeaQ/YmgE (transglycosylase-associated protein family)